MFFRLENHFVFEQMVGHQFLYISKGIPKEHGLRASPSLRHVPDGEDFEKAKQNKQYKQLYWRLYMRFLELTIPCLAATSNSASISLEFANWIGPSVIEILPFAKAPRSLSAIICDTLPFRNKRSVSQISPLCFQGCRGLLTSDSGTH